MDKELFIEDNKRQYKDVYFRMNWISETRARQAEVEREALLKDLLSAGALFGYNDTKTDCRDLSPGCRCCGDGTWSCLFVNGICNCRCFYCPTTQDEKSVPTTNSVEFPNVHDYIEYLDYFGFKGVGLSGGEPLLTPDLTLEYLSEIKKTYGDKIHVWLYTNGTRVTETILGQLKEAGLDEIRFDIGASSYNLDKVKLTSGYIDTVTIEIPAVPEDYLLLTEKLPEMKAAGVHYLNLHQLRCSPFNYKDLIRRNYTFLHGPKVTVLESELTALKLLKYSLVNRIDLPINYCSFIYKNRRQAIAARRSHAAVIKKNVEHVTPMGIIRTISLKGDSELINRMSETLRHSGGDPSLWSLDKTANRIFLHPSLYPSICHEKFTLYVSYHITRISPTISYMYPFKEIKLKSGKRIAVERQPVFPGIELREKEAIQAFGELFLLESTGEIPAAKAKRLINQIPGGDGIWDCERIPAGLLEYF